MKKKYGALILMLAVLLAAAGCRNREEEAVAAKPVIYLYPEKAEEVSVWLDYDGELTCTYPAYEDGWHVIARPDGTLQNLRDGQEYSYLFWEGTGDARYDMNSGFVVKGEDTAGFLQEKLSELGLTPAEYNEFIVYWLPKMQGNPWNLITFQTSVYTEQAKLHIEPKPDSVIRVFMAYRALEKPVEMPEPILSSMPRKGFTVVEWGGTEVK